MFVAVVAVVADVAVVAVPTVIDAGSLHCGAEPLDVRMRVDAPIASFDRAVPEA